MPTEYPVKFNLEDGIVVEVNRKGNNTFDFTLTPEEGQERHFTLVNDSRTRDEKTEKLDFDQLNAVRALWLRQHNVV